MARDKLPDMDTVLLPAYLVSKAETMVFPGIRATVPGPRSDPVRRRGGTSARPWRRPWVPPCPVRACIPGSTGRPHAPVRRLPGTSARLSAWFSGRSFSVKVHGAELVLRTGMALPGSFAQPVDGVAGILVHPVAPCIFVSQVVLRRRMSLLRSQEVPACSLGVIFGDILAVVVPAAEKKLGAGISPVRRPLLILSSLTCARSTGQTKQISSPPAQT